MKNNQGLIVPDSTMCPMCGQKRFSEKIDPDMSIEDVLLYLIGESGFSEIKCIFDMVSERFNH